MLKEAAQLAQLLIEWQDSGQNYWADLTFFDVYKFFHLEIELAYSLIFFTTISQLFFGEELDDKALVNIYILLLFNYISDLVVKIQ